MPRVTRAAQRTTAILEDEANIAAETPLPSTPTTTTGRAPLGEIVQNVNVDALLAETMEVVLKPAKKAKGTKKGRKKNDADKENIAEVLEDDNQSVTSSAVSEACEDLMKEHSGGRKLTTALQEMFQIPMHDARPQTPPSKAVSLALRTLSAKAQTPRLTPRFNPEVHKTPEADTKPKQEGEDSFVATIETRTPAKMTQQDCFEDDAKDNTIATTEDIKQDDSFAENIVLRSPIKFTTTLPASRIEDSVDEIDALEEEIEKIGESIPTIVDEPQSPVKNPRPKPTTSKPTTTETKATKVSATKKPITAPTKVTKSTAAKKATANTTRKVPTKPSPLKAPTMTPRRDMTPRTASAKPTPSNNSKPFLRSAGPAATKLSTPVPTTSPAQAPTSPPSTTTMAPPQPQTKRSRVSSLVNAPFVPKPSAKAPTRSTFTLPGEAITQKLKAQREERQKRDEEAQTQKRNFKARPVPVSKAPEVKLTVATKARLSLAKGEAPVEGGAVEQKYKKGYGSLRVPKKTTHPRISAVSSTGATVNGYTSVKRPRPSILPEEPAKAATTISARAPSLGGPSVQKSKGKEVFGRTRVEKDARDTERKVKEEAARKARAEAAERGRAASREWAEKMKAKKAGAATAAVVVAETAVEA
ncbi:hypothetical protein MMC30_000685 [Trapelia coarctata]|nr:hypothetical protein [Trapelia coarctata]